ncbi:hypothetical protein [Longivirga aurantiaca]|uniref:Uncharacterized protein n=1 Tax=Longivirga aurantiaca TaxID=1837743 RepID=A0ABW1T077_9ACTN
MSSAWSDDAPPEPERPAFRRSFAVGIAAALGLALVAAVLALLPPTVSFGGVEVACWAPALGYDPSAATLPEAVRAACAASTNTRLVLSLVLAIAAVVIGAVTTLRATTVPRTER